MSLLEGSPNTGHLRQKKWICGISLLLCVTFAVAGLIAYNREIQERPVIAAMNFTNAPGEQSKELFLSPKDNFIRVIVHSVDKSDREIKPEDELLKVSLYRKNIPVFYRTLKPKAMTGHSGDMADRERYLISYRDYGLIQIKSQDRYVFKIRPEGSVAPFRTYEVLITARNSRHAMRTCFIISGIFLLIGGYCGRYVRVTFS